MYRLTLLMLLALLFSTSARAELTVTQPTEILKAWIPIGFDNNDRVQVLIDGMLPNTCFRIGPYSTKVDPVRKVISLQQNVDKFLGFCLQMVLPFTQTIDIGPLEAADYTLIDQSSGRTLGSLPVKRATSTNIDDFLYANVREVDTGKDPVSGRYTMTAAFDLPNRCTSFKRAVVHYYPEVIVVQPILERIGTEACETAILRSQFRVQFKEDLHGTYLLHVRSLSGQAISRLVNIE